MPSSWPVPNFSGVRDMARATPYATMDEMLAPTPGNMPTKVPMPDDRRMFPVWPRHSRSRGNAPAVCPSEIA